MSGEHQHWPGVMNAGVTVADADLVEFHVAARLFVHLVVGQRPRQPIQEAGTLLPTFELAGVVNAAHKSVLGTANNNSIQSLEFSTVFHV